MSGLNNVIRALFFELHHTYGVAEVLGFRGGYQGLDPARAFGYLGAVEEAVKFLDCAHTEAHSVHNGLALVKLMGRHAGFIAAEPRWRTRM